MQSMYRFLEERNSALGVRISSENFSQYDRILVIPVYATEFLREMVNARIFKELRNDNK